MFCQATVPETAHLLPSVQRLVIYHAGQYTIINIYIYSKYIAHCAPPMIGPNVSIENYSVRDGIEGYQITYFCEYGFVPSSMLKAVCTFGGIWKPDPSRLVCTGDVASN